MPTISQNAYRNHHGSWDRDIFPYDMLDQRIPTILVVDDDDEQLSYFEVFLRAHGYDVLTAHGGEHGIKMLSEKSIDIVVCDAMMPDINGPDFIYFLRMTEPFYDIPAIIFSGGSPELEVSALDLGADMFCPKHLAAELLVPQIRFLLQEEEA